jgi:tRNA 2-thiouridine synthesizing protein E
MIIVTSDLEQAKEDRLLWGIGSNLEGLDEWNEAIAIEKAKADGLTLEEDHWTVLHYLRAQYDAHGDQLVATKLLADLEPRFESQGGKRYLYSLFPEGPISQGSRIAGLPEPRGANDASFGSVH